MAKPIPAGAIHANDDGTTTVTFTFTKEQLAELEAEMAAEDSGNESLAAGRKDYCCECHQNSSRHTISASNSFSAGFKCLKKCGGAFTMSKGRC